MDETTTCKLLANSLLASATDIMVSLAVKKTDIPADEKLIIENSLNTVEE